LEKGGLVVAGPTVASGPGAADVAGEHEREVCGAVAFGGMEPVVDALPWWMAQGLSVAMSRARRSIKSLGAEVISATGVEIVVPEVDLVKIPGGGDLDFAAVGEFDFTFPIQGRVEAGRGELWRRRGRDEGFGRLGLRIPDHIVAEFAVLSSVRPWTVLLGPSAGRALV